MPEAILAPVLGGVASAVVGGIMGGSSGGSQGSANVQQASQLDQEQAGIARDQYARYKSVGQPLEDQYLAESQGLGSQANQNKAAEMAAGATAGSYASARERLAKKPGGISQLARNQDELKLDLAEAGSSAGAQTAARDGVVARGHAALGDAVNVVKGMPATASSGLGSAAGGLMAAGQYQTQQGNYVGGAIGKAVGGLPWDKIGTGISNWVGSGSSGSQTQYNPWTGSSSADIAYG